MNIRAATLSDCDAIAKLHALSWRFAYRDALSQAYLSGDITADRRSFWTRQLTSPRANQHVIVAEIDTNPVGFACTYVAESKEYGSLLDNIHVDKAAHRKRIGTSLLGAVARHCSRVAGEEGLYVLVLKDNIAALNFYFRYGAIKTGADVWQAPDGGQIPRFRLTWPKVQMLAERMADLS